MDTFGEISSWIQLGCMLIMLGLAPKIARQFPRFVAWQTCWLCFGIGFLGMLESRILVILLAYDYDTWWTRFLHRYVTPLQVSISLAIGMTLLYRLLRRIENAHLSMALPDPARFVVNEHSIILQWDAAAEQLFGVPASEAIGMDFMELMAGSAALKARRIPIAERGRLAVQEGHDELVYALTVVSRQPPGEFLAMVRLRPIMIEGQPCFDGSIRRVEPAF